MNLLPNQLKMLLACLVLLGMVDTVAFADTDAITRITLRSTVRIAQLDSELTVGDIATVVGPQQDIIIATPLHMDSKVIPGKWNTIQADEIRTLLKESLTINTGSVTLTGNSISITRRAETTQKPTTSTETQTANPLQPRLQDHIERWIYSRLKTTAPKTRIQFATRDQRLLNTPMDGQIIQISEVGRSSKMSLRIVIYKDELIIKDTTIRCDVQIERKVRVTTTQIYRRTPIDADQSTTELRWLSPVTPIADPDASLNLVCKKTIDSGTILLESMLESPILIERGEIVAATSLSGSVSVAMSVRARSAGRLGELIELESRDRQKRFTARIAGPGRVVIIQKDEQSASIPSGTNQ